VHKIYDSNNRPICLNFTITCKGSKRFRIWAEELNQQNSKYADREISVDGSRTIFFNLPATPEKLFIGCKNVSNLNDNDFQFTIIETPLQSYEIYLDAEATEFLGIATKFAQTCGYTNPSPNGTFFKPKNSKFCIKYFPIIKDYASGRIIGVNPVNRVRRSLSEPTFRWTAPTGCPRPRFGPRTAGAPLR
jgi:hypothetical protein